LHSSFPLRQHSLKAIQPSPPRRINSAVVTITMTAHPVTQKPGYFPALLSFFFGFAFRGFGGALRIRRSASSNGIGVRSGLAGRSGFGSFLLMTGV
jgi:hypothetical protein